MVLSSCFELKPDSANLSHEYIYDLRIQSLSGQTKNPNSPYTNIILTTSSKHEDISSKLNAQL